jgi:hypothetical protein
MDIKPVSEILQKAGLTEPAFNALIPNNAHNYRALLFQPQGEIVGNKAGVRNHDGALAISQHAAFLKAAAERQADLAVTPEYSLPWKVLVEAIKAGTTPAAGKLWVLGCESITYKEIQALEKELSAQAEVLCEPLDEVVEKFLDPLAYVFLATHASGGCSRLVILVQFKTCPMGDADHFELANLQVGKTVYCFGQQLRLLSLICSDVFDFTDQNATDVHDRSLIIHIQLNPKPRHDQYRQYREKLLGFNRDETELVCLNWAAKVVEWNGATAKAWNNISASAWYLRPDRFDSRDATLKANHERGLYYTYLHTKRYHALFFNYKAGVFVVEASKVAHIGLAPALSNRRGPQLTNMLTWNARTSSFVDQPAADDGFAAFTCECGTAKDEMERIAKANPIHAERVLALCAGEIGEKEDWHKVTNLDSCMIDASEVIRRMTFCQDDDANAGKFRVARLKLSKRLMELLKTPAELPPSLNDFDDGFQFEWDEHSPHCNVRAASGRRATVIYMGELAAMKRVEATSRRVAEFLRRSNPDADKALEAKQRLAVWYQEGGAIRLHEAHRYVKIDQPRTGSEVDIAREE